MKISNTNVEFVEFDSKDVITTSFVITTDTAGQIWLDRDSIKYYNDYNQDYFGDAIDLSTNIEGTGDYFAYNGATFKVNDTDRYFTAIHISHNPANFNTVNDEESLTQVYYWLMDRQKTYNN